MQRRVVHAVWPDHKESSCSSQSASADTHRHCCDLYEKHISPLSRGPFWDFPWLAQPKEEGCIPEELCIALCRGHCLTAAWPRGGWGLGLGAAVLISFAPGRCKEFCPLRGPS